MKGTWRRIRKRTLAIKIWFLAQREVSQSGTESIMILLGGGRIKEEDEQGVFLFVGWMKRSQASRQHLLLYLAVANVFAFVHYLVRGSEVHNPFL